MNAKRNLQDDLRGTYARNWTVSDDHRKLKLRSGGRDGGGAAAGETRIERIQRIRRIIFVKSVESV